MLQQNETITLLEQLISRESTTPDDQGCQELMIQRLEPLGFHIERMRFGDVDNLWARRGTDGPLFVFAGHTDVVPTGPVEAWDHPPFQLTEENGMLYGRGVADMKASLAAMIISTEQFVRENPEHTGSIGFLITSDEEGPALDGTVRVIETLQQRDEQIDWCLVGEPTSSDSLGDTIKIGRRGSLNGYLTIHGKQGHVAYPQKAINPIHQAMPALSKLAATEWDQGNSYFPATSFQISNINSGTGAENVIPGEMQVKLNFRFSTESTHTDLRQKVEQLLTDHGVAFSIEWKLSGSPFITEPGVLVSAAEKAIASVTGIKTELSTTGGTSDGRFIAPTGAQVIELGPCNQTIHQINESLGVDEPEQLTKIYLDLLRNLLTA